MSKRILAFIVALMSFMMFIPVYADDPTPKEIARFQSEFLAELRKAESVLKQRRGIAYQVPPRGDVAVVGDLHGDYQVLTKIIEEVEPRLMDGSISKVVFLGDYMDRGNNSALTLYSLLKFYNEYPGRVIILRGNHETMVLSPQDWPLDPYFRGLDIKMFEEFFNALPIMAIINGRTLAVHGGIPARYLWEAFAEGILNGRKPSEHMEELKPGADPFSDAVYSMLWSDVTRNPELEGMPTERAGGRDRRIAFYGPKSWEDFVDFMKEKTRGTVYYKYFENLHWLIRGHQPCYVEDGFIKGIAFYQIGANKEITTVNVALENQSGAEELYKVGAKVAILPKEFGPPREWFTIKFEERCDFVSPLSMVSTPTYSTFSSELPLGARRI